MEVKKKRHTVVRKNSPLGKNFEYNLAHKVRPSQPGGGRKMEGDWTERMKDK